MKVSFLNRIKLAYRAFMLKEGGIYLPLEYNGALIRKMHCDNIRRKSNCQNEATVCLANPAFQMQWESYDHYHVCDHCAKKYTGTMQGESFK